MIFKPSQYKQAIDFIKKHFDNKNPIEIKAHKRIKTLSQVKYIWLLCTHIAYETGNTKEDIYQHMIEEYAPVKTIYIGQIERVVKLTLSQFTKEQAMIFINNIITNFNEYDLPDPEDVKCLQMYEYYKEKGL
jgi:hypothetical protein